MVPLLFFLFTSWTTEVVTTGPVGLLPGIIALDSVGNPYILISRKRNGTIRPLYYLFLYSKNGGIWIADTFELNAEGLPVGRWDLTIDRYNCIWCIYAAFDETDTTTYSIVARKNTSGWEKDTVELNTLGDDFLCQSIATDITGVPHIAYDHMVNGWSRGFYAYLDDTIWQKTHIDSHITQYYCSIDLDSQNNPHISYFRIGSQGENLSHAYRIDSIWFREEIDSSNDLSHEMTSIAIGTDDLPSIAYRNPTTYQIKYAFYDGTVWHIDTVDVSGGFETQKSLDIDSLGQPYFIYARSYNSYLAYKTTSGWHKELLPLTPTVTKGFGGSLRIGKDGIIHIARFATNDDYTYREIHYIHGTPEGIEEDNKTNERKSQISALEIHPNPFRGTVKINLYAEQFSLSELTSIKLKIYDVSGALIKHFDYLTTVLSNKILWDGTDDFGEKLPSGVYFCCLERDDSIVTKKIIKLR
jgi:hypothetical protein